MRHRQAFYFENTYQKLQINAIDDQIDERIMDIINSLNFKTNISGLQNNNKSNVHT